MKRIYTKLEITNQELKDCCEMARLIDDTIVQATYELTAISETEDETTEEYLKNLKERYLQVQHPDLMVVKVLDVKIEEI